jgi:hypothetical protein
VESGAIHVSVKSDVMGVLRTDGVRIIETNQLVIIIGNQYNFSTLCQTLLHAVKMGPGRALGCFAF